MNKKDIIQGILVIIIFSFVFVVSGFIFQEIFFNKSLSFIKEGFGAFLGAFFAFLFIRLGEFFSKLYKRKVDSFNGYVFLERAFNEHLVNAQDNVYVADAMLKILKNGDVATNKFTMFSIPRDSTMKINNIEFINDIFSYNINLTKINSDMERLNEWYHELKMALLQGNIKHDQYKILVREVVDGVEMMKKYNCYLMDNKIIDILAKSRILIQKEKTFVAKIFEKILGNYKKRIHENELKKEIEKLKKEIEIDMKMGMKELNKWMK